MISLSSHWEALHTYGMVSSSPGIPSPSRLFSVVSGSERIIEESFCARGCLFCQVDFSNALCIRAHHSGCFREVRLCIDPHPSNGSFTTLSMQFQKHSREHRTACERGARHHRLIEIGHALESLTDLVPTSSTAEIGHVSHPDGRLPEPGVQTSRQCQSVQSIIGSTLHPHQRLGYGSEESRSFVASRRSAEPVQPVRDPDQCCLSVSRGQHAQHLHHDYRQGLRQSPRRQHGRRTRQAQGRA